MISILTDSAAGGNFLVWTLHYLAGHNEHYFTKQDSWVSVPNSPLKQANAHNFKTNHAETLEEYYDIIHKLLSTPTDLFHSIYVHPFDNSIDSVITDTSIAINHLSKYSKKTLLLTHSDHYKLYQCKYKARASVKNWNNPKEKIHDPDEIHNNFIDYFFNDSKRIFDKLKLDATWDRREFLALNIRPFKNVSMRDTVDLATDHYALDTADLYNMFDCTVIDLFKYLELPMDHSRFDQWNTVYSDWKKFHYQQQQFIRYFDKIINYTLNGYHLDLTRFDLDLMQEAAIQHVLIYKHNLNLKTWQLDKFFNTQQLHNLLEANTHSLSNY